MPFDWSMLGRKAPTTLVRARLLAHHAAQWASKTARANLDAVPDDGHASLTWDAAHEVLFCKPLSTSGGDVRIGLRINGLALVILRDRVILDTFELAGRRDSVIAVWLDSALRALGLKPASGVRLPYTLPAHAVARGSAYNCNGEAEALGELAQWVGAAAEVLEEVRTKFADVHPGAGPVCCWPHHFDIATLVRLEEGSAETARSVGIGFSPGDEYYAQPYVYISPWPRPDIAALPQLPPPGHWHTQGFLGAVATGEAILVHENRAAALRDFIDAALGAGSVRASC